MHTLYCLAASTKLRIPKPRDGNQRHQTSSLPPPAEMWRAVCVNWLVAFHAERLDPADCSKQLHAPSGFARRQERSTVNGQPKEFKLPAIIGLGTSRHFGRVQSCLSLLRHGPHLFKISAINWGRLATLNFLKIC